MNTTWRGTTTLHFQDIGSFTYAGTKVFVNGVYVETSVQLLFESHRRLSRKRVEFLMRFRFDDVEIEKLRDQISSVIATHMLRRLNEEGSVRWTPHFTFERGGLAIIRSGKPGGEFVGNTIPFNELTKHEFKEGVFYLYPKMGFGHAIEEKVSEPNFFPGYFLLLLLTTSENGALVTRLTTLKEEPRIAVRKHEVSFLNSDAARNYNRPGGVCRLIGK